MLADKLRILGACEMNGSPSLCHATVANNLPAERLLKRMGFHLGGELLELDRVLIRYIMHLRKRADLKVDLYQCDEAKTPCAHFVAPASSRHRDALKRAPTQSGHDVSYPYWAALAEGGLWRVVQRLRAVLGSTASSPSSMRRMMPCLSMTMLARNAHW